jgi:integrase
MSLFKRGRIWWYSFRASGVRIRESTGLTQKSAAAQAEAVRRAEVAQHGNCLVIRQPSPKFADFALGDFRAWSESQHREHPSTHERYMRSIKVLLRFFSDRTLDAVSSGDVDRFKIERSRERRKHALDGRSVSPASVNRDLAVLRILFNLAIRSKKVRANPVVGARMLPENNLQMRVVSWEEEFAYLAAASQPLRDVATLILETGMRPGEVFHLRREHVDLDLGFVRILEGKTPFARRTVPLTEPALTVLRQRISPSGCDWLFPSRYDPARPVQWLRKAHLCTLRKAKINPPFRLYDLRHTALTRMAMAGVDLPTLRELAGHASIQMTMRYVHPTPEHKRAAMEKLAAFCALRAVNSTGVPGGSAAVSTGGFRR